MSDIPPNWTSAALADIAPEPVEQRGPEGDGLFTYIDISSIDKETKQITTPQKLYGTAAPNRAKQRLRANDVIVSMTRPNLNAVARVGNEFDGSIGSTGFCVLRSSFISQRWLEYRVQDQDFVAAMSALVQGALYPAVRPKDVLGFRTLLPPKPEQDRIADEIEKQFTRLDDAVTALKRVQANLKRYRASVLKAACEGRLVPTEAELARKEGRDYEPASELLKRILAERRAKWEADQLQKMIAAGKPPKDHDWKAKYKKPEPPDIRTLPELPKGWTWATWEQIGVSQNGRPFPSKEYSAKGVRLLRPGNLSANGRLEWTETNTRFLPQHFENENPDLVIGPNELVINLTAQSLKDEFLGRVCLSSNHEHCLLNQRLARLTPLLISRRYALWMFKSNMFRKFVDTLNTGSLIQHMFTSQLVECPIPVPPLAEQCRIADAVEEKMSSIESLETACQRAASRASGLRIRILASAFSGKLVPQDPNDEPASVLLERIRAERASSISSNGKNRVTQRGKPQSEQTCGTSKIPARRGAALDGGKARQERAGLEIASNKDCKPSETRSDKRRRRAKRLAQPARAGKQ